jgi:hypothetical protein
MKTRVVSHTINLSSIEKFFRLLNRVYNIDVNGRQDAPIFFENIARNKLLSNPVGGNKCFHYAEKGEYGGAILLQPRTLIINGIEKSANYPTDLATDSSVPLLSLRLFSAVQKEVSEAGEILYNTSNNNSEALYQKVLKKKPSFDLDYRVFPLSPRIDSKFSKPFGLIINLFNGAIRLILRTCSIRSTAKLRKVIEFGPHINEIIQKLPESNTNCSKRDIQVINWRFKSDDEYRYELFEVLKNDCLKGYLIAKEINRNGLRTISIIDFYIEEQKVKDWFKIFLDLFVKYPLSNGILVFGNFGCVKFSRSLRKILIPIPNFLKPQKFPIYFEGLEESEVMNIENTCFDIDVP